MPDRRDHLSAVGLLGQDLACGAVDSQRRRIRQPASLLVQRHNIRVAVDHLRQRGVRDLANITLFSDGTTVYECTSAEEVVDLLQGGQGVFGIAVSGAMRELTGAIADFPGERADGGESISAPEDELASRRKHRDRKIG
jgi:hypothetical protein